MDRALPAREQQQLFDLVARGDPIFAENAEQRVARAGLDRASGGCKFLFDQAHQTSGVIRPAFDRGGDILRFRPFAQRRVTAKLAGLQHDQAILRRRPANHVQSGQKRLAADADQNATVRTLEHVDGIRFIDKEQRIRRDRVSEQLDLLARRVFAAQKVAAGLLRAFGNQATIRAEEQG